MKRALRPCRLARNLVLLVSGSLAVGASAQDVDGPPPPPPVAKKILKDGRHTLGRFLPNLGRDVVGVVSRDNLYPFLIGAGAAAGGAFFDDNVERYFSQKRRAKAFGDFGDRLGQPYVIAPMALALYGAGRLDRHHQRFRDATYDIAEVTLVAVTYTTVLKYATMRERPDGSNKLSFPSGHAANAFAWATVGADYYGWKLGVPGYLVAGLIGVSRMEKNVHHLSDVLAGAGIGILSGRAVVRRDREPLSERKVSLALTPATDPHGQGLGLRASLRF